MTRRTLSLLLGVGQSWISGLAGGLVLLSLLERLVHREAENGWPVTWLAGQLALPLTLLLVVALAARLKCSVPIELPTGRARILIAGVILLSLAGSACLHPSLGGGGLFGEERGFPLWDPRTASGLPALLPGGVRTYHAQAVPATWLLLVVAPFMGLLSVHRGLERSVLEPAPETSRWLGGLSLTLGMQGAVALSLLTFQHWRPADFHGVRSGPLPPAGAMPWQSLQGLPPFLAACGAITLALMALHLLAVDRTVGSRGAELVLGRRGLRLRLGLLFAGLLPQTFWAGENVPTMGWPLLCASALLGGLLVHAALEKR